MNKQQAVNPLNHLEMKGHAPTLHLPSISSNTKNVKREDSFCLPVYHFGKGYLIALTLSFYIRLSFQADQHLTQVTAKQRVHFRKKGCCGSTVEAARSSRTAGRDAKQNQRLLGPTFNRLPSQIHISRNFQSLVSVQEHIAFLINIKRTCLPKTYRVQIKH